MHIVGKIDKKIYSCITDDIVTDEVIITDVQIQHILKAICDNGERFQTILRLCTSKEPEGFKNSIITFMKIDEKRWKRYMRTKEILYSREYF